MTGVLSMPFYPKVSELLRVMMDVGEKVGEKCLTISGRFAILYKSCEANRDLSSAGRASALQAEGHRFEPCRSHFKFLRHIYGGIAQLARAYGSYP